MQQTTPTFNLRDNIFYFMVYMWLLLHYLEIPNLFPNKKCTYTLLRKVKSCSIKYIAMYVLYKNCSSQYEFLNWSNKSTNSTHFPLDKPINSTHLLQLTIKFQIKFKFFYPIYFPAYYTMQCLCIVLHANIVRNVVVSLFQGRTKINQFFLSLNSNYLYLYNLKQLLGQTACETRLKLKILKGKKIIRSLQNFQVTYCCQLDGKIAIYEFAIISGTKLPKRTLKKCLKRSLEIQGVVIAIYYPKKWQKDHIIVVVFIFIFLNSNNS
eukprot:TRINITY_DN4042_c0_g1_i14.p1 TRINITY_DN4042_c0_g1~~TRINITY_DN4042_c0_g1_i14.p1  ORF type:complete len:266 (+),score=-16.50 TRINITY_DN4042_c0_g1_i14:133-930(+)